MFYLPRSIIFICINLFVKKNLTFGKIIHVNLKFIFIELVFFPKETFGRENHFQRFNFVNLTKFLHMGSDFLGNKFLRPIKKYYYTPPWNSGKNTIRKTFLYYFSVSRKNSFHNRLILVNNWYLYVYYLRFNLHFLYTLYRI